MTRGLVFCPVVSLAFYVAVINSQAAGTFHHSFSFYTAAGTFRLQHGVITIGFMSPFIPFLAYLGAVVSYSAT